MSVTEETTLRLERTARAMGLIKEPVVIPKATVINVLRALEGAKKALQEAIKK